MLSKAYDEVEKTSDIFEDALRDSQRKYEHYYKPFPYKEIDVYRILEVYEVAHPCIQHAIKKLLVCGTRGSKDQDQDITEAIDSLLRWKQMKQEEYVSNT